jgi:hypothetical protein
MKSETPANMAALLPGMQRLLTEMQTELARIQAEIQAECLFAAANDPPAIIVPDKPAIIVPELQLADDNFLSEAVDRSWLYWITGPTRVSPDRMDYSGRVSPDLMGYSGYSSSSKFVADWVELVHPEDRDMVVANYLQSCEARKSFCLTFRLLGKDDRYRWVTDLGVPRYQRDGSFAGHIGKVQQLSSDTKIILTPEEWKARKALLSRGKPDVRLARGAA